MNLAKQQNKKLIFRNQWHSYTPIMNHQKEKFRKQSHLLLQQQQKNKVSRNKFNQGGKRPILEKLQDTEERS